MASNSQFPKTDPKVNQTKACNFTDVEEAEGGSYLVDGEMPCNLADRIHCASDTLFYNNAHYTNHKFYF